MIRECKVCGESYRTCYSCEKERSWRIHTDTLEHYYIWTVLMEYQGNHDAKAAYAAFRKRRIDIRDTAGYAPRIQELLAEISNSVRSTSRSKKAETVTPSTDTDTVKDDITDK